MKKYNIFEFSVVKVIKTNGESQYFICRFDGIDKYIEIFTKTKIKMSDCYLVEPLTNYYSLLSICNYATGKPLMLSMTDLLIKYSEINCLKYVNNNDNIIKR